MSFPTPKTLFAAAAASTSSPEDEAIIERGRTLKADGPKLTDDEVDTILAAAIRISMRSGRKFFYVSVKDRNCAELELLAHRLRDVGFTAEANPPLPLWARLMLITRDPGLRIAWNPAELAAAVSSGNGDKD